MVMTLCIQLGIIIIDRVVYLLRNVKFKLFIQLGGLNAPLSFFSLERANERISLSLYLISLSLYRSASPSPPLLLPQPRQPSKAR